jgi:hypothetical protein
VNQFTGMTKKQFKAHVGAWRALFFLFALVAL